MSKRKLEEAEIIQAMQSEVPDVSKKKKNKKNKKKKLESAQNGNQTDESTVKVWRNKQRVLVFCSRGTTARYRHVMNDLRKLLPHSKKEVKMDKNEPLYVINEICELKNCNNCIYFDVRKKMDCYMWVSKTPNGPSAKFHLTNLHTLEELRMFGNCLLGSRPILYFDKNFDLQPQWALLKELFTQIFCTPNGHPNSKPFIDHVFCFYIVDNRIWFRNYQIVEEDKKKSDTELVEIGPRFVLNPIRIFSGSFGGATLYQNADYVSPNEIRSMQRRMRSGAYMKRVVETQESKTRKQILRDTAPKDELADVFEEVKHRRPYGKD